MITQTHRNVSRDHITELAPNEIFIYGSNEAGKHGRGAALIAHRQFGAQYGNGITPTGRTYPIPTKSPGLQVLPLNHIAVYIDHFVQYAREHQDLIFLVTQVGCGLAALTPAQIAPLFLRHILPPNVHLPEAFWAVYDAAQPNETNGPARPTD